MTIPLYQTPDMEAAARVLIARNHYAVIHWQHTCYKRIRMRLDKLHDIPVTFVRVWDAHRNEAYAQWRDTGGLMIYQPTFKVQMDIECEGMLFVECPTQSADYEKAVAHVSREVVVYRPPTWELHTETVLARYPTSEVHLALTLTFDGLMGRNLTEVQQAALRCSGRTQADAAVFYAQEIEAITGITDRQLRMILKPLTWRRHYVRYHCYTPAIRPDEDEPDLRWAFDMLEANPDVYKGMRMLRFDVPTQGLTHGFLKYLKLLIRKRYVIKEPQIFVIGRGFKAPELLIVDAIANARRDSWRKMRDLVDESQEYFDES